MDLEGITLSEISQTREDKCYEHSYMWTLEKKKKHHQQKSKFIET